jgi:hypothetical protein
VVIAWLLLGILKDGNKPANIVNKIEKAINFRIISAKFLVSREDLNSSFALFVCVI